MPSSRRAKVVFPTAALSSNGHHHGSVLRNHQRGVGDRDELLPVEHTAAKSPASTPRF